MDEEAADRSMTLVTPEVSKLKGGMRRNSTGNTISRDSVSSSNSHGKIQPRYLRPSMGSCHDFCKYGKKDASEAEGQHPFRRRSLGKNTIRGKERNQLENLKLQFSGGHKVVKKAVVPTMVTGSPENHIKMKLETPSPSQNSVVSADQMTSSKDGLNQLEMDDTNKRQVIELKATFHLKNSPEKPGVTKPNASDIGALGEPIINEGNTVSRLRKSAASVCPKVIKQKPLSSVKKSISSANSETFKEKASILVHKSNQSAKSEVLKHNASAYVKRTDLSTKPTISLKRRTTVAKPISVLNPLRSIIGRINQESQITKTLGILKSGKKKILKQPADYLPTQVPSNGALSMTRKKYKNAKSASTNKNQEKHRKAVHIVAAREEKILYLAEQKSGKIELDPVQRKLKDYEVEFSDSNEAAYEEEVMEGKLKSSKGEDKRRYRKTATVHGVEGFSKPQKLRFRRGKVVDLQPENTGPRRLRFRQRRVLDENSNGAARGEKTLYVAEQESGKIELDLVQRKLEDYEVEFSDSNEAASEEEVMEGKLKSSKGEDKRRNRKTATVHGVEGFSKPQKLRFRRGKVVDLQPENTGPRRLRFKQGRVLGENSNGSGEVRKKIVIRELIDSVSNDPVLETETIVLRHQDTQGKKDSQGLFNHVIEETATKLVEARKSKVKALVGAFETVISLQEIKPAQSEFVIN